MSFPPETPFPLHPPLPVPEGFSQAQIRSFLRTVRPADAPPREMQNYCDQDWRRFLYTWGLVRHLTGECLELGSNPYFTTILLQEFTRLRITLANYFGPHLPARGSQEVFYQDLYTATPQSAMLDYHHFSVESDPFPFDCNRFDVVLFCEIIEHLQADPIAVLREIQRVLKPGGTLVLTTPNVSRLENVARMVAGVNIYDPYSGYGPYGRHNREYNKHELYLLLDYCGFDIETMFSADVHSNHAADFCSLKPIAKLVKFREHDLGQYIFVRCHSTRSGGAKRPSWLYRSYPEAELE